MVKFIISTNKRYELIDITDKVEESLQESKKEEGIVTIFVPHSTAAVLLTENETNLKKDWVNFLKDKVKGYNFNHNKIDNNADSHILSGLIGQTKVIPFENGKLERGTWQQIFLVELDGPRKRKLNVKII